MSLFGDRLNDILGTKPQDQKPKSNNDQSQEQSGSLFGNLLRSLVGDTPSNRSGFDFNQGVGMYNTTIDSFSKWYDESMAGLSEMGRDNINLTETNEMAAYYLRRAGALRQWANENKDLLGDNYQSIMDSIQQVTTASYWMDRGYKNQADDLLTNFKTIEEYYQYIADKENQEKWTSYDIVNAYDERQKMQAPIDVLRSDYNDLYELEGAYGLLANDAIPEEERQRNQARYDEIISKYGEGVTAEDLYYRLQQMEGEYGGRISQLDDEIAEAYKYQGQSGEGGKIGSSVPWEDTPKKTAEDYRNELEQLNTSIASMSNYIDVLDARYEELDRAIAMYSSSSDPEDISRLATAQNELNTLLTQRNNANQEYDAMMSQKWQMEKDLQYETLSENVDYSKMSGYSVANVNDQLYRYINNQNGMSSFLQEGEKYNQDATFLNNNPDYIFGFMSDEQVANYNYIYATQGKEAAMAYLEYLRPQMDAEKTSFLAGEMQSLTQDSIGGAIVANALSVPLNLAGGIGYLDIAAQNMARDIRGDYAPINYNSAAMLPTHLSRTVRQTTAGMITDATGTIQLDPEKNPFFAKILNGRGLADVYQLGMSMADSRVAAAVTKNPAAATALLASSAATQGVLDALERGATDEEALKMGMFNGAFEALFEYAEIGSLLKGNPNAIKAMVNQAITEGAGEGFTSIFNNVADAIIMADKSAINTAARKLVEENPNLTLEEAQKIAFWDAVVDIGWDAIGGAASGGISAGGMSIIQNTTNAVNTGKSVQQNQMVDPLMELANQMAGLGDYQGKVEKYAQKTTQRPNAYNVGRLYNETTRVIDQQNMDQLAQALQAQGMTKSEATKLASAIALDLNGIELTKAQERLLEKHEGSEAFTNAVVEVLGSDAYMNRNNALRKMHGEAPMAAQSAPRQTKTEEKTEVTQPKVETTHAVSEDGETHLVAEPEKTVSIQGIEEIKDGTMKLRMDDGTVVDAGDVSFATPDEAMVYSALADMGMNVNAANLLASAFKTADISGEAYTLGIRQAYQLGQNNDRASLAKGEYSSALTEHQRDVAFKMGKIFGGQQTAKAEATIRKARKNAPKNATEKTGKVHFDRNGRTFDDVRETALKTMEQLSAALGTEFYVYESYVNEKGQRVYKDENGIEVKAPNGWYDPATGAIHIDLNAGNTGKGTMLFTISHELTHFIHQWSPAKFKVLANFLVEQYNQKGQSVEELIEARLARAKRNGNDEMTRDIAFEEVVADSMESMLKSGNVVETMALLKQQDKSLWQKIVDWFKDLAEDLKKLVNAYQDVKPDSVEGKMVEDMQDVIVILESLYADALIEAGENYKAVGTQKNTTQEGGVKMQIREIIGQSGKNYGIGVYLNSNILTNVPENQREAIVRGQIKEFGGRSFVAYDRDGNPREITVASQNQRFKNTKGKSVPVNGHMTSFLRNPIKQEALVLVDEVIAASSFEGTEKAEHPHEWLDNDGKNPWDVWTVLLQEKNESVWEATLKVANSANGEKFLYELYPIKEVEAARKPGTSSTDDIVSQQEPAVKAESAQKAVSDLDISVDEKTESVAPAVLMSERTWTESDYVQDREEAALAISKAIGVTTEKAKQYIDDISSIAKMIAEDRTRLDYFSSPYRSSFVSNVEYGGSFDFSTLCKKRRLLTGTFTAIQKALPNTALTANEILDIRNRMKDAGLEVSCGLCYVEGSRANMGQFAKEFLRLYKQYNPDAWQPNMADVNTPDGIEWVRINHPECYEQYEYFWNHYGTLKPGDKNLFASQQKPKLYQLHTEYKGEILQKFDADNVEDKNINGGIRLQSFSDFEIVHLIDTMQIIMDMSRVGLAGQAYTKVPDFAWALGDTGLKINLSLIAKGVDENGKLIFDDVEGMPIAEAMRLRDRYSENVGTILVAFNDQQLMAAMADDRVDFIIPFHRSQWKKSQYEAMGLPAKTKDYTYMQNEKFIKPQYHEYRDRMVRDKATNYMPNEYWDFNKSGKENAIAYLEMCARNNKRPKFYKLLTDNKDGSYSLKADGSTDGYWKLLIDFKMYDNQGKGSPQRPVRPDFNMDEANRMLDDYNGGHSSFPVAQGIVDQFVAEYKDSHKGKLLSERDAGAERVAETLRKENVKLKEDVKYLKELLKLQRSVTNGTKFTRSSVEAAAGMLMRSVNARGDKSQLTELLNGFYEYIAAGEDLTWENVMEKAEPISDWLMRNQVEKHELDGFAQDVLRDIRGSRFYLDDQQKQNVAYKYGSYNEFRKKMMGTAVVSDKANMSLDSWWHDMAGQYPSIFDETISSSDMPEAFADAIDRLRSMEIDPYGYDFDREMMARDIMYQVYDSYWNVSTLKTVADVKQKQINELKGKHADRIEKIRAEHRESRARLQKQFRSELAAVKKDMRKAEQEHIQKAVERQRQIADRKRDNAQKAEMRRKIRKTIRDLDKLFSRGDKKKNVKEGMRDFAATALASAEVLFTDEGMSEHDMIRNGIRTPLHEWESKLVNRASDLLKKLESPDLEQLVEDIGDPDDIRTEAVMDVYLAEQQAKIRRELSEITRQLQDVFARERIAINNTLVTSLMEDLAKAYAGLNQSTDPYIKGAYRAEVYEMLHTMYIEGNVFGYTRVKDMTLEQLDHVYRAYKAVLTSVRKANELFAEGVKESVQLAADSVMIEESLASKNRAKTKLGRTVSKFMWNNLKPVYAFERIGSKTLSTLYGNIRKGQDTWAIDMREANEFRKSIQEKYGYDSWDMDELYTFKTNSGADFKVTLEQLMSIYAYSKRAHAYDHMMKGGFVFDDNTTTKVTVLGVPVEVLNEDAHTYKVSMETLSKIVGALTEDQTKFVDEMQDYLSTTMGEKGNSVSMKLYGIKLFNEKNYFPLKSSAVYSERAREANLQQEQGQINLVNAGFAKSLAPNASTPIVLSGFMDVWSGHVNDMSMYHSFVLPMEDFRRVYNYSTPNDENGEKAGVIASIQNAHGTAATSYIDQLYKDLNGGALSDSREGLAKSLVGKFKKAAVMASLSVVFQQPSAIGRAFSEVDLKHFHGPAITKGTARAIFAPKKHDALWEELKKYAPVAMIKEMGYFDTGMGMSAQEYLQAKEYKGIKEKAGAFFTDSNYRDEVLSKGAAVADELTWIEIWKAIKNETAERNPDMDRNSEEFLKIAGTRFAEVIDKTQVYDSVLARSANMRSKSIFMNMATSFMAEPTTTMNMVWDALTKASKGQKKAAARAIASVAVSIIINAALSSIIYAARDDDEDETYLEKYLSRFLTDIMDSFNPITYIPILKDMWSIAQGFDVERADMSLVSDLVDSLKSVVKIYSEYSSDMDKEARKAWNRSLAEAWADSAGVVFNLFGIPARNMAREVNGVVNMVTTLRDDLGGRKTTWRSLSDVVGADVRSSIPVLGWLPGRTKADKLFDALQAGDQAYADRLIASYGTEKKAQTAIRNETKERYLAGDISESEARDYLTKYCGLDTTEAYWKMKEWDSDKESAAGEDFKKYDQFYEAVKTGANLKAVIKEYTDNGVKPETLRGQITEYFKPEYVNMSASDRAGIKGYLLNAMVACGQDREKAEITMMKWDFEASYGYIWDDRADAYRNGAISASKLVDELMLISGKTREEAELQVEVYDWQKDIPNCDITATGIRDYHDNCESAGISRKEYYNAWRYYQDTSGEFDEETGESIPYSKVKKVMAYINGLNLTAAQKTALASCWWGASTVKEYKLW